MDNTKFDYQLTVDTAYLTDIEIQANKLRAQAFADLTKALFTQIAKIFKGAVTRIAAANARSRVLRELYAMDDRTLEDIGITRGDIEDMVSGKLRSQQIAPVPANLTFLSRSDMAKTGDASATSSNTDKVKIAA